MVEAEGTGGRFVGVCLRPRVVITPESPPDKAVDLHATAHRNCFIANSVNFPVSHQAELVVAESKPESDGCD